MLSVYCGERGISADVSVVTEYGASLLPGNINVLTGKLDSRQMGELMESRGYTMVIDATHPYAVEATLNIKKACREKSIPYYRLCREISDDEAETVSMDELTDTLDMCGDTILSTLGSGSLPQLTRVKSFRERIWLRLLPAEGILDKCAAMGFDRDKIILKKGPFSVSENIEHIELSRAKILVTKNSGAVGGYNEKKTAARSCGIRLLTLERPKESGLGYDAVIQAIERIRRETE